MLKSFKYKISPTEAQAELINKHIGSSNNKGKRTKNKLIKVV